jgi:DNA (cytosine-5)-methyltransferase 1
MTALRVGGMFAGIGGLELGIEEAFRACGYSAETVYQIELAPLSRAILERHWPKARRYADISVVEPSALPAIDLAAIGFPCTDLSTAGKGAGIEYGKQSSLWKYGKEILRVQRPPLVVIENINQGRQRWLPRVFSDLEGLGYSCRAHRVAASDLGAPHERARCFVVATDADGVSLRKLAERLPRRRPALLRRPWQAESPHDGAAWFAAVASHWAAPPRLHGVDDGVPGRLDEERLKAIGNAVSPPVAYAVGLEAVRRLEAETGT